jgi:hypothetical protein
MSQSRRKAVTWGGGVRCVCLLLQDLVQSCLHGGGGGGGGYGRTCATRDSTNVVVQDSCSKQLDCDRLAADVPETFSPASCVCVYYCRT